MSITLERRDWLIGGGVFLLALLVYAKTLAPTVTAEDSGELVAAAYLSGVAHPPGYPLWCMLTKPFFWVPHGDMAWRANFASAVWGALTCLGVFLLARRWGACRIGAWVAAMGLAFSQRFWSQSVITEVYTLNTALFVGLLHAMESFRTAPVENREAAPGERGTALLAVGCLFGLALTNHYQLALLVAPGVALLFIGQWRWLRAHLRVLLYASGACLAMLLVYLYLPLAAARNPFVNWGNPDTWSRFWAHIDRSAYRELEFATRVTGGTKLLFFGHAAAELWRQFTPWLLVLLPIGFVRLWRQQRCAALASVAVYLLNTAVLLALLHFTFERENRQRVEVYYLPAYCMAALWVGLGASALRDAAKAWRAVPSERLRILRGFSPGLVAILLLASPLLPLRSFWPENDRSRFLIAREYAEGVLQTLEPKAILFPSADFTTFPIIYLMGVEGLRPDVMLADKYGTLEPEVHALFRELSPGVKTATKEDIFRTLVQRSGRPVYVSARSEVPRMQGFRLIPWGLVYRLAAQGERVEVPADLWRRIRVTGIEAAALSADPMERGLASDYLRMSGEVSLAQGERDVGVAELRRAADAVFDDHKGLNNIGSVAAEYGEREMAMELYARALAAWPDYVTPYANLAAMAITDGDLPRAAAYLRQGDLIDREHSMLCAVRERYFAVKNGKASSSGPTPKDEGRQPRQTTRDLPRDLAGMLELLEKEPDNHVLQNNIGTAYAASGDFEKAAAHWKEALRLRPDYAIAHRNLAQCYEKDLHNPALAEQHRREYERLTGGLAPRPDPRPQDPRELLKKPPGPDLPRMPEPPQPPKAPQPGDPREALPDHGH